MNSLISFSLRSLLLAALTILPFTNAQLRDDENPIILLSEDPSFHFELLVALGEAVANGGSDVAPVLGAAKNITAGDFDSWTEVFWELANQTKAAAEDPELAYDAINVRDTWFSTATYFRRADFYLHGNPENPLINYFWEEQLAAFDKGLAALPIPGHRVQIPADNFTVEAIWYPVSTDNSTKRPTIILGNGYDGAQEDLYHSFVPFAHARGWNAITYEGPGQPKVRREQNLGFIPQWERAVTPVVDYLLTNQSTVVDATKLSLFGYSFGGYLAARAAAFEPRITALLLDGGIWDAYDAYYNALSPTLQSLLDSGNATAFDSALLSLIKNTSTPTATRWGAEQGLWAFNTPSPYEYFQMAKQYRVEGWIDRIHVPTWVADVSDEGFYPGQSKRVAEALGDRATYHLFEGVSGYHCQIGSLQDLNRVVWAWLNKVVA
ncbi:MAG: hypothetical protein Q9170_003360 [Blastenia crenularia]